MENQTCISSVVKGLTAADMVPLLCLAGHWSAVGVSGLVLL